MVQHIRFVNTTFSSNTYILSKEEDSGVWIVDPGNMQAVWEWMTTHKKNDVLGILLTHTHFDHIYGVNEILDKFPDCLLFVANEYGLEGLSDIKQNGSKYTGNVIVINKTENVRFLGGKLMLWPQECLTSVVTPGHSDDSVCFIVENLLFTGDTLIKDVRTVTKIRGGSVEKLEESIRVIGQLKGHGYHVCPGHGEEFDLDEYDLMISVINNKNPNLYL